MENRQLNTASSLDRDNLHALYEELRGEALDASVKCCRRSQGLALLIQRGMAAWIQVWRNCTSSPLTIKRERGQGRGSERNLPVDLRTEVAILLSNMALRIFKEAKRYDE